MALDPAGILISNASRLPVPTRTVAFGGGFYLVTWADYRSGTDFDVYGARVSSGGVVQEPTATNIPIAIGPTNASTRRLGAAYASPNFVLAFGEADNVRSAPGSRPRPVRWWTSPLSRVLQLLARRSPTTSTRSPSSTLAANGVRFTMKGTRINAAGVDIDPVDWARHRPACPYYSLGLAAVSGSTGKSLATYSRYDSTPGVTSDRVRTRVLTRAQSDVGVTNTDGRTSSVPGQTVTYTMTVSNAGPQDGNGSTVTDTLPATITGATWACVGAGGATCTASGSGSIADVVNLPSGGSLTYTLTGTISPAATGSLSNTVTVAPLPRLDGPEHGRQQRDGHGHAGPAGRTWPSRRRTARRRRRPAPGSCTRSWPRTPDPRRSRGATVTDTLPAGDHRRDVDVRAARAAGPARPAGRATSASR